MRLFQGLLFVGALLVSPPSRGDEPTVCPAAACCQPEACPVASSGTIITIEAKLVTVPQALLKKYCGQTFDGKPNNYLLDAKPLAALLAETPADYQAVLTTVSKQKCDATICIPQAKPTRDILLHIHHDEVTAEPASNTHGPQRGIYLDAFRLSVTPQLSADGQTVTMDVEYQSPSMAGNDKPMIIKANDQIVTWVQSNQPKIPILHQAKVNVPMGRTMLVIPDDTVTGKITSLTGSHIPFSKNTTKKQTVTSVVHTQVLLLRPTEKKLFARYGVTMQKEIFGASRPTILNLPTPLPRTYTDVLTCPPCSQCEQIEIVQTAMPGGQLPPVPTNAVAGSTVLPTASPVHFTKPLVKLDTVVAQVPSELVRKYVDKIPSNDNTTVAYLDKAQLKELMVAIAKADDARVLSQRTRTALDGSTTKIPTSDEVVKVQTATTVTVGPNGVEYKEQLEEPKFEGFNLRVQPNIVADGQVVKMNVQTALTMFQQVGEPVTVTVGNQPPRIVSPIKVEMVDPSSVDCACPNGKTALIIRGENVGTISTLTTPEIVPASYAVGSTVMANPVPQQRSLYSRIFPKSNRHIILVTPTVLTPLPMVKPMPVQPKIKTELDRKKRSFSISINLSGGKRSTSIWTWLGAMSAYSEGRKYDARKVIFEAFVDDVKETQKKK